MFVSLAFVAAAQVLPIVVPLQKPPRVNAQPIAPIETTGPAYAAAFSSTAAPRRGRT
jgi:hypothetical protein